MYKQVLTYNFSDDDTRYSFQNLIERLGFTPAEDQSTYVLDYSVGLSSQNVQDTIAWWAISADVSLVGDDFVQIFYATPMMIDGQSRPAIGCRTLRFNPRTNRLL